MDFETIQSIWTDHSDGGTPMPTDALIQSVLTRDRTLARKVRVRDHVELLTAVVMAAGLLVVAVLAPTKWPWAAAAALTLGVGIVFVRERRRRSAAPASGRLRERLTQALGEADHQIALLGSVFWWYLLPLFGAALLIVVGTILGVRGEVGPDVWARARGAFLATAATATVFVGVVFGLVWWMNLHAVRRQLKPHRDEIAALLRQLDANGVEEGL